HLVRKFVSFCERDGPAALFGKQLLDYAGLVFEYWHDYKAGKLSRQTFVAWMAPVREQVEAVLAQAMAADVARLSGSCADILEQRQRFGRSSTTMTSIRRITMPRGKS